MDLENNVPAPETAAPTEEAQAVETVETSSPETDNPTGSKPVAGAATSEDKGARLHAILAKIQRNPAIELNDSDLELYMEYDDGRGKLKPTAPKSTPKAEGKEEAEKPEGDLEKAPKEEAKTEKPEAYPHIEAAMKEVGAKNPEELAAKIKELRAKVSGKETETVARLKHEHEQERQRLSQNEAALWRDFVAGKPEAIDYVNRAYGVRPQPPQPTAQEAGKPGEFSIDPDADALTGGMLSRLLEHNKALEKRLDEIGGTVKSQQQQVRESGIRQTVAAKLVDDMIAVAPQLEGIKDIPGLRNRIIERVVNRKEDPALDAYNEIFQVAEETGTDLPTAYLIMQGRKAPLLLEAAREAGRKEAYKHQPNRSLSGIVTEDAQPQSITAEQLKRMETDPKAIPNEWFDGSGNLIQSKIPKKAWATFGFE